MRRQLIFFTIRAFPEGLAEMESYRRLDRERRHNRSELGIQFPQTKRTN
jgi:hypothetical protein